ncbi:uncharacterized protein LOC141899777 isoform X2 [Tubulanus polymorphus]|uniref:uncharacterized protein LOC141899777 isoform X2 n=1 Tax=Tubulanus polymorphus TaxID=672921 RepID=UPI003DA60908
MSSVITQAPNILPGTEQLPLPAIICIAIGCYIFIVAVALIIKQCLQSRGMCGEVQCCGKEGDPCCACCLTIAQACNCCQSPSVKGCMDRCCPNRRHFDCVDIILCQCCTPPGPGKDPLCGFNNMSCTCGCSAPECENINCLCFEIKMKALPAEME